MPSLPQTTTSLFLTDDDEEIDLVLAEVEEESDGGTGTADKIAKDVSYLKRLAFRAAKDESARYRLKTRLLREMKKSLRKGRRAQQSPKSARKRKRSHHVPKRQRPQPQSQSAVLQSEMSVPSKITRRSSLAQLGGLAGVLSLVLALVVTVKLFAHEESPPPVNDTSPVTHHENILKAKPTPKVEPAIVDWAADESSLRTSLDKWREQQQKLLQLFEEMNQEKELLVCTLQESGVSSGEDLNENSEARISADELLEIVKTTAVVQKKTESLVLAIAQGESLLRKIHRQQQLQEAGISSEESAEFVELRVGIEEMLHSERGTAEIGNVLQLDDVLKRELKSSS